MKRLIIIPVKDEKDTLSLLIRDIKRRHKDIYDILVINDNTEDITLPGSIIIINNKRNLGKGCSIRKGFGFALANDYDYVIMMDADGEHETKYLQEFSDKIESKTKCDLVLGKRKKLRSGKRKAFSNFTGVWMGLLGYNNVDYYCGYKAISSELLRKMILKSRRYEIEIEILLEALKNKANYKTVLINLDYRKSQMKLGDFVAINLFFDVWVLRNKTFISKNYSLFKYIILITAAMIGLFASYLMSFFLSGGKQNRK